MTKKERSDTWPWKKDQARDLTEMVLKHPDLAIALSRFACGELETWDFAIQVVGLYAQAEVERDQALDIPWIEMQEPDPYEKELKEQERREFDRDFLEQGEIK